jgi:3-oxoacyl-(acyl-carrier-protein) synthase
MGLFGLEVATEALAASGIVGGPRVGVFCGVGGLRAHWEDMASAFANQGDDGRRIWERGLRDVHPYWMLRHLSNNVHALASAGLGLRGEGATFGGGNGGAQAIAAASRALWDGAIDAALVVAYDSLLEPETLVELGARRAATHASLARLAAPYATDAAGFVPGEAAAAIVLIREAFAPLAWIDVRTAAGAEADATATLVRCAATLAGGASVIAGAARAWPDLDGEERDAVAALVGREAPLVAPSAAMGQLGAATSVVQAIVLAEALRAQTLPPIAGLEGAAAGPLVPVTRVTSTAARIALGLDVAAPGLAAAIRVEVAR